MNRRLTHMAFLGMLACLFVGCTIPSDDDLLANFEDDIGFTLSGGAGPGDIVGFDGESVLSFAAANVCLGKPAVQSSVLRSGMSRGYMLGVDDGTVAINTFTIGNISGVLKAKNVRWVNVSFDTLSTEAGYPDIQGEFRRHQQGQDPPGCFASAAKTFQTGDCPEGFAVYSVITAKGARFQLLDANQKKMSASQFMDSLKQADPRFTQRDTSTISIGSPGVLGIADLMYINTGNSVVSTTRAELAPRCPNLRHYRP